MPYKPIEVKSVSPEDAHRTLTFEDDIKQEQEDITKELEAEASKPKVEAESVPEPKVEKPHKSRAQERIKTLVAREKEALFRAEQAELRVAEMEKKFAASTVSTKESLKAQLEDSIKSLHSQTIKAMQEGDSEKAVELNDKLISAKMELSSLIGEIKVYKEEVKQPIRQAPQPQISDKAQDWITSYPEFNTDELFHAAAIVVNNQLLREGFDAGKDEFYEELSQRLAKKFPEVFGIETKNGVQWNQDSDSPEADEGVKETAPVVKPTSKARTSEQTVSGSSRPSANVIQKKNSTEVQLTAEDIRQAELWGLDLKTMARRIAHKENNSRGDGYVAINIPKS